LHLLETTLFVETGFLVNTPRRALANAIIFIRTDYLRRSGELFLIDISAARHIREIFFIQEHKMVGAVG
jgi:hypothetical protein